MGSDVAGYMIMLGYHDAARTLHLRWYEYRTANQVRLATIWRDKWRSKNP